MLGIGRTLARFPAATALIASAALLSAAGGSLAGSPLRGEEVAMAIPRVAPFAGGVALPQPLEPSEAARIRRIFRLHAQGAVTAAAHQAARLDTSTALGDAMLGLVTADRYFTRPSRVRPDDLQEWLARWPDLPDAPAIRTLLTVRLPRGIEPAPRVQPAMLEMPAAAAAPPESASDATHLLRNPDLDGSVADAARTGSVRSVRRLLAHTKGLSFLYGSQLAGEAARILFTLNHDAEAFSLATDWLGPCAPDIGQACAGAAVAPYAGGLAAWRLGLHDRAGPLFEAAWRAALTTPALRAASAYWAARSHPDERDRRLWLRRAGAERTTFYGLLARRTLALSDGLAPGRFVLGEADVEAVSALAGGERAFALLQVGQKRRAESELRQLWPSVSGTKPLARAVILVAQRAELPELAAQMTDALESPDLRLPETPSPEMPTLAPDGGFSIDPALVYGLTRTESDFDPDSESQDGALGLMQILPQTASFVAVVTGRPRGLPSDPRAESPLVDQLQGLLRDPALNLDLGQRYVTYLSGHGAVQGDLLRLLASYNCGPGRVADWAATLHDQGDPLLFLEAIPIDETRAYVPRVLAFTWLYAARLGLPAPSLDELASGLWPRYHPLPHGLSPSRLH